MKAFLFLALAVLIVASGCVGTKEQLQVVNFDDELLIDPPNPDNLGYRLNTVDAKLDILLENQRSFGRAILDINQRLNTANCKVLVRQCENGVCSTYDPEVYADVHTIVGDVNAEASS